MWEGQWIGRVYALGGSVDLEGLWMGGLVGCADRRIGRVGGLGELVECWVGMNEGTCMCIY